MVSNVVPKLIKKMGKSLCTAASGRNPKANNTILNSVIEVFNNEVQTGIKNQEKAQVENQNELKALQNPLKWFRDLE